MPLARSPWAVGLPARPAKPAGRMLHSSIPRYTCASTALLPATSRVIP